MGFNSAFKGLLLEVSNKIKNHPQELVPLEEYFIPFSLTCSGLEIKKILAEFYSEKSEAKGPLLRPKDRWKFNNRSVSKSQVLVIDLVQLFQDSGTL